MDADARPDVVVLRSATAMISSHSRCRVEMLRKPLTPRCRRVFKHFVLALDQAFVIEVAMAVDQPHAAASSSSSSSRGNSGVGCGIGVPPSPASIRVSSLSADSGNDRRDRLRELAHGRDQRAEHRRHPLRIGLAQRPRRLRIDIGVAGENRRSHASMPDRESEALECFGQLVRVALLDLTRASSRSSGLTRRREERRPNSCKPSTMCAARDCRSCSRARHWRG